MQKLLDAFIKLNKYGIFWRLSQKLDLLGIDLKQRLSNVNHINLTTFFPQNELLANPRTRLLITNGWKFY